MLHIRLIPYSLANERSLFYYYLSKGEEETSSYEEPFLLGRRRRRRSFLSFWRDCLTISCSWLYLSSLLLSCHFLKKVYRPKPGKQVIIISCLSPWSQETLLHSIAYTHTFTTTPENKRPSIFSYIIESYAFT